jgi:UDPglucose--hexose-1-phosphate uridylyltransferase
MSFEPAAHDRPHRRTDLLTGRHVLVSPQRANRPWQGATHEPSDIVRLSHDPNCHLCAGNFRAGGMVNPEYRNAFVFDNDFAALELATTASVTTADPLFEAVPVQGCCRVICFSPDHSATLPELSPNAMREVVDVWCAQSADLGRAFASVQIFENKGAMMGCSNPHPHGQIWATDYLPDEVALEDLRQHAYFLQHGRPMLLDVAMREIEIATRVIVANESWVAIVPFWASWPFETLLLPRFEVARMNDLGSLARDGLAEIVQALTKSYDNLFATSFPYSMGWHGAPYDDRPTQPWQLHAHFYPPLLRSASVRKFMVGFEMLAEAQRDLTPEAAAERLRAAKCIS